MKTRLGRKCGLVWLGIAFLGLVLPLSAQQPELRFTLKGHRGGVTSVAFSPDGKLLASGSADKTIKLWDVATGKKEATMKHTSSVLAVVYSPDGKLLASG